MENKIMNEKVKIMNALKKFKEQIALHNHKIKEKALKILEGAFEKYEKATDEDEDDLEYLIDIAVCFDRLFQSFLNKYNIDYFY